MRRQETYRRLSWRGKFACALSGLKRAIREEINFFVHFFIAAAAIVSGLVLGLGLWQWCLLALCIAAVLAAELFNTAIERMARAVTDEENEHVRDALDTSAAAVLMTALGAVVVGGTVFVHRLGVLLDWWSD